MHMLPFPRISGSEKRTVYAAFRFFHSKTPRTPAAPANMARIPAATAFFELESAVQDSPAESLIEGSSGSGVPTAVGCSAGAVTGSAGINWLVGTSGILLGTVGAASGAAAVGVVSAGMVAGSSGGTVGTAGSEAGRTAVESWVFTGSAGFGFGASRTIASVPTTSPFGAESVAAPAPYRTGPKVVEAPAASEMSRDTAKASLSVRSVQPERRTGADQKFSTVTEKSAASAAMETEASLKRRVVGERTT